MEGTRGGPAVEPRCQPAAETQCQPAAEPRPQLAQMLVTDSWRMLSRYRGYCTFSAICLSRCMSIWNIGPRFDCRF